MLLRSLPKKSLKRSRKRLRLTRRIQKKIAPNKLKSQKNRKRKLRVVKEARRRQQNEVKCI